MAALSMRRVSLRPAVDCSASPREASRPRVAGTKAFTAKRTIATRYDAIRTRLGIGGDQIASLKNQNGPRLPTE